MLQTLAGRLRRMLAPGPARPDLSFPNGPLPDVLSMREMVRRLAVIPHWEDKIAFARMFHYCAAEGHWARVPGPARAEVERLPPTPDKIHYGCGSKLIEGWLNVDWPESTAEGYRRVDLLEKHPFADSSVGFGFAEDVLEHFSQAESIFFLSEVLRTLAPGGVLRLSFPGLEGVLARHYTPASEQRVRAGELEAYAYWGHVHFYGRDELRLVATHLGYASVCLVEYGKSEHRELCGLDTRSDQIGLNTYVELTK